MAYLNNDVYHITRDNRTKIYGVNEKRLDIGIEILDSDDKPTDQVIQSLEDKGFKKEGFQRKGFITGHTFAKNTSSPSYPKGYWYVVAVVSKDKYGNFNVEKYDSLAPKYALDVDTTNQPLKISKIDPAYTQFIPKETQFLVVDQAVLQSMGFHLSDYLNSSTLITGDAGIPSYSNAILNPGFRFTETHPKSAAITMGNQHPNMITSLMAHYPKAYGHRNYSTLSWDPVMSSNVNLSGASGGKGPIKDPYLCTKHKSSGFYMLGPGGTTSVNAGHLCTDALFYNNPTYDGPLEFVTLPEPAVGIGSFPWRTWIMYNSTGNIWRLHTPLPMYNTETGMPISTTLQPASMFPPNIPPSSPPPSQPEEPPTSPEDEEPVEEAPPFNPELPYEPPIGDDGDDGLPDESPESPDGEEPPDYEPPPPPEEDPVPDPVDPLWIPYNAYTPSNYNMATGREHDYQAGISPVMEPDTADATDGVSPLRMPESAFPSMHLAAHSSQLGDDLTKGSNITYNGALGSNEAIDPAFTINKTRYRNNICTDSTEAQRPGIMDIKTLESRLKGVRESQQTIDLSKQRVLSGVISGFGEENTDGTLKKQVVSGIGEGVIDGEGGIIIHAPDGTRQNDFDGTETFQIDVRLVEGRVRLTFGNRTTKYAQMEVETDPGTGNKRFLLDASPGGTTIALTGLPNNSAGLIADDIWYDPAAANVLKKV